MADVPQDLKYTEDHEWLREENGVAVVGITHHAQSQLGDVVFVDVPKVGQVLEAGAPFGTVESVKAVSELFAPVSGKVVEVNTGLEGAPDMLNDDPYGDGWIIKIQPSDAKELNDLLSPTAYSELLAKGE